MTERWSTDIARLDPVLELAAEVNGIGFFAWRVSDDHLVWNHGAEERLGFARGEVGSFGAYQKYIHPDDVERLKHNIELAEQARSPRLPFIYRVNPPTGKPCVLEGIAYNEFEGDRLVRMYGVNIDVTERENARLARERSEAQLRAIIATAPDPLIVIDQAGVVLNFNAAAERVFGRPAADIIGSSAAGLLSNRAGARKSADLRLLATRGRSGGAAAHLLNGNTADGRQFPAEVTVTSTTIGSEPLFIAFVRDISDRVAATERLEDMRLRYGRYARLNTLGEVAAGLAHELNQPLAACANFLGAAELGLRNGASGEQIEASVHHANAQIARAGEIIRRLRNFLSEETRDAEDAPLREMVDEAAALALVGRDRTAIQLTIDIDPGAAVVHADPVQVQQVLVNVLRNAIEAMGPDASSPMLTVSARRREAMVAVSVTDNGPGFVDSVLANANLPFLSTKGEGMGLGLSICRRIVESQKGRLEIGNDSNGGARVLFTLPSAHNREGAIA